MSNHARSREFRGTPGPYWLVCDCGGYGRPAPGIAPHAVMTLELADHGEVLPTFGSEEDARRFVEGMSVARAAHELVPVTRVRLVSALLDTLAMVDRVAFDPSSGVDLPETVELASLGRGTFVDILLGRGKAWSTRREQRLVERPSANSRKSLQPAAAR